MRKCHPCWGLVPALPSCKPLASLYSLENEFEQEAPDLLHSLKFLLGAILSDKLLEMAPPRTQSPKSTRSSPRTVVFGMFLAKIKIDLRMPLKIEQRHSITRIVSLGLRPKSQSRAHSYSCDSTYTENPRFSRQARFLSSIKML